MCILGQPLRVVTWLSRHNHPGVADVDLTQRVQYGTIAGTWLDDQRTPHVKGGFAPMLQQASKLAGVLHRAMDCQVIVST